MLYLFTTNQVIRFSHIPKGTLRQWRIDGIVRPAVFGSVGVGHADRYRPGQVLGLVMVQCLRQTIGCNLARVRELAATDDAEFQSCFEKWQQVQQYSDEGEDAWAEEEVAAAGYRYGLLDAAQRQLQRLFIERSDELFRHYAQHLAPTCPNVRPVGRTARKHARR
jgi:hypothetical protein